jgi:hypothetical protein
MPYFLYRGVSVIDDKHNGGKLIPKGKRQHIEGQSGDSWVQCGEGVECGSSDGNAVVAHQFDSDKSDTMYISTSRSFGVAKKFATCGNLVDGFVYILDPSKFNECGVVAYERAVGSVADEAEIAIKAQVSGPISDQVIVSKKLVNPA